MNRPENDIGRLIPNSRCSKFNNFCKPEAAQFIRKAAEASIGRKPDEDEHLRKKLEEVSPPRAVLFDHLVAEPSFVRQDLDDYLMREPRISRAASPDHLVARPDSCLDINNNLRKDPMVLFSAPQGRLVGEISCQVDPNFLKEIHFKK